MNRSRLARTSSTRKREDRTIAARYAFDPLVIETKNVNTALLLMQDPDPNVMVQALAALDKFASKAPENVSLLMNLDIINNLLPLLDYNEIYVRRFATKLLAQLCSQDEIKRQLLEETSKVPYLCEVLAKETDVPLQEFSSAILAELTKMNVACAEVLESNILDTLFTRLKSTDPDVQHNSAQVMLNLLSDPEAAREFIQSESFDFAPILNLLQSEYPAIQNVAISLLDNLTRDKENEEMQKAFRQSKGLEDLMDILEMFDWKDLHPGILNILGNVVDNPATAQQMNTSGCTRRLVQYIDDIHDAPLIEMALDTIAKMASIDVGRKMLMEYNIVETLLRFLRDENPNVTRAACIGVGNIIQNQQALEAFIKENPLREIMSIIKNEALPWDTRHGAAVALCSMLDSDRYFCDLFLSLHQQDILLHYLKNPGTIPVEMLETLLHCLAACAVAEETRTKILETDITEAILPHLESPESQLCIAACFCLSAYACEAQVRESFYNGFGVIKLIDCLKNPLMPVRQAAASLLQILASDTKIATSFIGTGALEWMLGQKQTQVACPAWETAIATLFRSCLPAKFYYMGRIDMQDVTGEIFYVMRKATNKFIVLDEMFAENAAPLPLLYVANFGGTAPTSLNSESNTNNNKSKSRSRSDSKRAATKRSNDSASSKRDENENALEFHGHCAYDKYLIEYVQQIKKLLKNEEDKCSRLTIHQKVAVLASFVASKMCGMSKSQSCTNHTYELHITELKVDLGTSIIPLGFIRVGLHFERAVLFKVLADQTGIPCALVRGEYGRCWIEIASPQADPPGEEHPLQIEDLPTRLLKPNCIVDLMDNPGKLLPIGSFEAAEYCNPLSVDN